MRAGNSKSSKWGFINKSGKWAIKPRFDGVGSFENGLVYVRIGEKIGYIDTSGNYVWEPRN